MKEEDRIRWRPMAPVVRKGRAPLIQANQVFKLVTGMLTHAVSHLIRAKQGLDR